MKRIPRRVRKQVWKLLGYATPKIYRLGKGVQWRAYEPMRRAFASMGKWAERPFADSKRAIDAFCSAMASLGKDYVNALP